MPPLAQRNLFHDKVRLAVTLTGIVFAVVLIVVELGLFVGFTVTTSNLIDNSGADLWVTSKHVPYVEQGVPFSERKVYQVRAVPGVAKAEKLITRWVEWKRPDGRQESVQVVGLNVDENLGTSVEPGARPRRRSQAARRDHHGRDLQAEAWRRSCGAAV